MNRRARIASHEQNATNTEPRATGGGFRLRGQVAECFRVAHGEIGQYFAVHFDAGDLQAVHELAVGKPVPARGSTDALYPESAILALLIPAIAVGVLLGANHGFLRGLKELALGEEESLCAAKILLAARAPSRNSPIGLPSPVKLNPRNVPSPLGSVRARLRVGSNRSRKNLFALIKEAACSPI